MSMYSNIILGKGFCFEDRQKRIIIDDEYYYPDLVFYHRILHCSVIVELKTVQELLDIHSAQLLSYLRLTGNKLGLLINFNTVFLRDGIQRVVNGL